MRRVDPIGRAAFDDARIDPLLVKYSMGLALIAMRLVREHGLELEHADPLNLPDAIPPVGPFEFTATTRTGSMHFVCYHDGSGTVRIQTDHTGSAEWEVDLRSDRERELSH